MSQCVRACVRVRVSGLIGGRVVVGCTSNAFARCDVYLIRTVRKSSWTLLDRDWLLTKICTQICSEAKPQDSTNSATRPILEAISIVQCGVRTPNQTRPPAAWHIYNCTHNRKNSALERISISRACVCWCVCRFCWCTINAIPFRMHLPMDIIAQTRDIKSFVAYVINWRRSALCVYSMQ